MSEEQGNINITVMGCTQCPGYRYSESTGSASCFFSKNEAGESDLAIDPETAADDIPQGCPLLDTTITLELDAELLEFSR